MKLKTKSIPRTTLTINRSNNGFYRDGIYTEEKKFFKVKANIQPYNGLSLQADKDAQWQKSTVLLFTEKKIIPGDAFKYLEKNYVVKTVENYDCSHLSHYESIAHEYEKEGENA